VPATADNIAKFEARRAELEAQQQATLAEAQTRATALAELELARQRKMLSTRATSRREFEAANAAVATLEAARKADAARIDAARVDLGYTRITAPVAGRMGKDELTIGNLVRGDAPDSPRLSTLGARVDSYYEYLLKGWLHTGKSDEGLLEAYQARAAQTRGVTFVGRLGSFRYLDMDTTIRAALDTARAFLHGA
jgi:multidrug efflux pump subunit AcrA (membrane-fusion protein)